MKFRMDKTLRFWVDVAYEDLKSDHEHPTKGQLVAQILRNLRATWRCHAVPRQTGKDRVESQPAVLEHAGRCRTRCSRRSSRLAIASGDRSPQVTSTLISTMTNFEGMPSYFWLVPSRLKKSIRDDVPYTDEALRQDLLRVRNAWEECQASRDRGRHLHLSDRRV